MGLGSATIALMSIIVSGAQPTTSVPAPGTAQATLLNILGDVVAPAEAPVPTSALIEVMGMLDFSAPAARQGISRCAAAGWISKTRTGRSTRWSLTRSGTALVEDGIAGVELLSSAHEGWDGRWRVLIVTITNEQRSTRDRVYRALRWDGFGNPLPSVWISPHQERYHRIGGVLSELGLDTSTLSFTGEPDGLGFSVAELVARSWELGDLEAVYSSLVARFRAVRPTSDAQSLIALLRLDEELQQLLVADPHLPAILTPGWAGRESAAELLELRAGWRPAARRHWRRIVESQASPA